MDSGSLDPPDSGLKSDRRAARLSAQVCYFCLDVGLAELGVSSVLNRAFPLSQTFNHSRSLTHVWFLSDEKTFPCSDEGFVFFRTATVQRRSTRRERRACRRWRGEEEWSGLEWNRRTWVRNWRCWWDFTRHVSECTQSQMSLDLWRNMKNVFIIWMYLISEGNFKYGIISLKRQNFTKTGTCENCCCLQDQKKTCEWENKTLKLLFWQISFWGVVYYSQNIEKNLSSVCVCVCTESVQQPISQGNWSGLLWDLHSP